MAVYSETISETAADYLRLQLADNVGPIMLGKLIEHFATIGGVLSASESELSRVDGIGRARASAVLRARDRGYIDEEIALAADYGVRIICREDPDYPQQLKHTPDPPICLYVRGRLEPTDAVGVAIVGSRRCTHYGTEQARRFGAALGRAGFTVVSGLARGIDSCAHQAALEAGGRTVAVLGNGLASVYPPEHANLAERVVNSGALLSEFPMLVGPDGGHFPRRNRIIAGMTLGVIVIEASRRSGALITARLASEYNREVFALPGRVDVDTSVGTNRMIRRGEAKLITCLEDILDELGDVGRIMAQDVETSPGDAAEPARQTVANLSEDERRVLDSVKVEETGIDAICDASGLPAGKVASALTSLQLKGSVRQLPGNVYVLRRRGS